MSARSGRTRTARRARESARRAPAPTALLRRRLAAALASCSEEEQHVLALLVGERLSPAETSVALEIPASQVLRVRATLFETLRLALVGRDARRSAARLDDDAAPLRRAS